MLLLLLLLVLLLLLLQKQEFLICGRLKLFKVVIDDHFRCVLHWLSQDYFGAAQMNKIYKWSQEMHICTIIFSMSHMYKHFHLVLLPLLYTKTNLQSCICMKRENSLVWEGSINSLAAVPLNGSLRVVTITNGEVVYLYGEVVQKYKEGRSWKWFPGHREITRVQYVVLGYRLLICDIDS